MAETISFVRIPSGSVYANSVTLGSESDARRKFIASWVHDDNSAERRYPKMDLWQSAEFYGYRSESIVVPHLVMEAAR